MNHWKTLVSLTAIGLAATAMAADKPHMAMSIAVVDDATQEEVRVDLDSDTLGFDLDDMQVGENRSVVDKNGQNVLITREEEGFRFDVNGKTIRAPLHDGPIKGEHDVVILGTAHAHAAGAMHGHVAPVPPLPPFAHGPDGIAIISAEPIDEATQQEIEDLLKAAGHGSDVRFIDRSAADDGRHEVRIIEKRVEVTE